MISVTLLLCCMVVLAAAAPGLRYDLEDAETHFEAFIDNYNKVYSSESEKRMRCEIFKANLIRINEKNIKENNAVFGINKFADLEQKEFMSMYTGLRSHEGPSPCVQNTFSGSLSAPESFDWRDQNKVTRVKDQENCGSCWTFGTTGNIESQYAILHNKLVEVSESQLLDCDDTSFGCGGGFLSSALLYTMRAGGIMSEKDYPYVPEQKTCRFDKDKVVMKVKGCNSYNVSSEDELKEILYQTGPLALGLDGNDFDVYNGGILKSCNGDTSNHAVLLVGYGTEGGVPFWTMKNSWGANWGEDGYIRVERNINACDILAIDHGEIVSAVLEQ